MTLNRFIVFLKFLTTLTPVVTNMAQCFKAFLSVIYYFSQKVRVFVTGKLFSAIITKTPGACIIKTFVILRFRSKLVCLSKAVKMTDNRKDTSLLQNLSIFHKLWLRNFLQYRPHLSTKISKLQTNFCNIGPWTQFNKPFFCCHLWSLQIS